MSLAIVLVSMLVISFVVRACRLFNWNLSSLSATLSPPPRLRNKPVTYLGLDEARAYCRHYGKRLPHMWEWQKAAQVAVRETSVVCACMYVYVRVCVCMCIPTFFAR